MLEESTKVSSGVIGNNIAVNTNICVITNPGRGRYRVWGTVRHTLADGAKLIVGAALVISRISSGPERAQDFGPIIIDINNDIDDVTLQLAVATGAADTASATIYAQKIN